MVLCGRQRVMDGIGATDGHALKDAGAGAGPFVPTCLAVRFRRPTCGQSTLVESTGRVPQLGQWFTCGRWPGLISDYQSHHGGLKMLVLSRKQGEVIMVGEVAITIVRVYSDRVRVGITAPPEVAVDRLEVREAKQRETAIQQQQEQGK